MNRSTQTPCWFAEETERFRRAAAALALPGPEAMRQFVPYLLDASLRWVLHSCAPRLSNSVQNKPVPRSKTTTTGLQAATYAAN